MKDDTWFYISGCLQEFEEQMDILNDAHDGLMISPESPLIAPIYVVGETLVNTLALLANDKHGFISWFVYECDFGNKPQEAGIDGEMRLIDSHDRLRWILEANKDE